MGWACCGSHPTFLMPGIMPQVMQVAGFKGFGERSSIGALLLMTKGLMSLP